jgi:hypothetical protein
MFGFSVTKLVAFKSGILQISFSTLLFISRSAYHKQVTGDGTEVTAAAEGLLLTPVT